MLVRAGVRLVPSGGGVFPGLTVRENLELGAWCRPKRRMTIRDRARVYSFLPCLEKVESRLVSLLNPGGCQLLVIGRVVMARPKLLLLDEPTRGLSPVQVRQLFAVLERLAAEGVAVLLAECHPDTALGVG